MEPPAVASDTGELAKDSLAVDEEQTGSGSETHTVAQQAHEGGVDERFFLSIAEAKGGQRECPMTARADKARHGAIQADGVVAAMGPGKAGDGSLVVERGAEGTKGRNESHGWLLRKAMAGQIRPASGG